jgi:hypothetical protein
LAANTKCVNDAEVIYSVNITDVYGIVGNVQLTYSPSCRATWARLIADDYYGSSAQIASVTNPSLNEYCTGSDAYGTGCNTPMINDANMKSEAYGTVYLGSAGDVSAITSTF